ncbi:MAG: helix-turn-helix domain-containing protein [Arsenophonus sp.]|uniref:AAA family ATPase n=2 Tax=Arsenophonus sp. TaxID=1872640 RepID=UPI002866253F|nr:AAA family ATPase [Arsenophonus sp.]MDR5610767.1 helix-turn-helix domain-containing protein [Arsenophonus sp.]
MLKLKTLLQQHNLTQAALARALDLSEATLAQIVNHHQWPKQDTDTLKHRIRAWLRDQSIEADDCFDGVTPDAKEKNTPPSNEEDTMLLKKQVLLPATKKHFGLFRAPFDDQAIQGNEDVFLTPESRYVREALYQTARYGGFIAVIGESGSGKSTLRRDLTDRIYRENAPVVVIEEAHCLPIPTLKHLKRFFELEDGIKKLLSIVLLGQPELSEKLSERLSAVREVVQRCEVIDLPPLDEHLTDFLDFKFKRVGGDTSKVLGPDAIPALRQRLSWLRPKKDTPVSLLYPLAIGNLVTAAMNLAAQNAIPVIDANIIHSVH